MVFAVFCLLWCEQFDLLLFWVVVGLGVFTLVVTWVAWVLVACVVLGGLIVNSVGV